MTTPQHLSGFSLLLWAGLTRIMPTSTISRINMAVTFTPLGTTFAAEVSPLDLRQVRDRDTLMQLRAGMDQYAVLVFRNQPFTNEEQLDFAQRFDGQLHAKTSVAVLTKNRYGNEALTDISNVNAQGDILAATDRLRASTVSNRLWHTDASFEDPAGRYSMLSARVLPPVRADTEFADMRAAYDALDPDTQRTLEGLRVYHSIVYSRHVLGFEFGEEERARLKGAGHPLVPPSPPPDDAPCIWPRTPSTSRTCPSPKAACCCVI